MPLQTFKTMHVVCVNTMCQWIAPPTTVVALCRGHHPRRPQLCLRRHPQPCTGGDGTAATAGTAIIKLHAVAAPPERLLKRLCL